MLDGMWRVPEGAGHGSRLFWGAEVTAGPILERGLAIEKAMQRR